VCVIVIKQISAGAKTAQRQKVRFRLLLFTKMTTFFSCFFVIGQNDDIFNLLVVAYFTSGINFASHYKTLYFEKLNSD